ncbi:AI-2E family transporter [Balneatrix alpica]|uniref:AI-2E family transporter n=1 Tax=Balneatrix alpica TaxID=75684 RepID=A0ABV5Z8M2_9GAMM|nr:AI-2E family transporter [Balneatrix alpica]
MTTAQERWLLLMAAGCALLLYLLQPILAPFLIGMLLAYLADPLADRLEARGMSRTWAVVTLFFIMTLILLGVLLLLLPLLGRQLEALAQLIPQALEVLQKQVLPWLQVTLGVELDAQLLAKVRQALTANWQQTTDIVTGLLTSATKSSLDVLAWGANLALIPVVTFYLLRDWDVLVAKIRELLPRNVEPVVSSWASECDEVLSSFMRGQLTVMVALGGIYALGLSLVGLKLALLIGMLAGLASIVPYLGMIVGLGAALIAALLQFDTLTPLIGVGVVFMVGQMLEGMVLTPWLVGDRIGLHPVAVIFAILAGGQLFGLTGILLALPIAAVIRVFLSHVHGHYKSSHLYNRAPGAARIKPESSDDLPPPQ